MEVKHFLEVADLNVSCHQSAFVCVLVNLWSQTTERKQTIWCLKSNRWFRTLVIRMWKRFCSRDGSINKIVWVKSSPGSFRQLMNRYKTVTQEATVIPKKKLMQIYGCDTKNYSKVFFKYIKIKRKIWFSRHFLNLMSYQRDHVSRSIELFS